MSFNKEDVELCDMLMSILIDFEGDNYCTGLQTDLEKLRLKIIDANSREILGRF